MEVLNFFADGSGHPDYRPLLERGDTDHYSIAGILVDDQQRALLESGCDALVQQFFPDREPRSVELKAAWISARVNQKPPWDSLPGPRHAELFDGMRDLLLRVAPILFGQVVHKDNYRLSIHASRPERPATNVLRFLMTRLDHHLERGGNTSRATLDEDSPAIQEAQRTLEADVRSMGDKISGVGRSALPTCRFEHILPFQHLSSDQSRCLQLADFVSHQLWQAAEYDKANRLRELDPLWARFRSRREPWTAYLARAKEQLILA